MFSRRTLSTLKQGPTPKGRDLSQYPKRVNLGCGLDYRPGWINVDKYAPKADQRFDMFHTPYPLEAASVDYVLCEQVLEHVPQRIGNEDGLLVVLEELHRILRPGGAVGIGVPYAGSFNDYQNVTHYRHFVQSSFDFLDPARPQNEPLAHQARLQFKISRQIVFRALRLGRWFDTSYHFPKYFAFDPNVGRKRALVFVLEKPDGKAPIEARK